LCTQDILSTSRFSAPEDEYVIAPASSCYICRVCERSGCSSTILARAGIDNVIPWATVDYVIPILANDAIIPVSTVDLICSSVAVDDVIACTTIERSQRGSPTSVKDDIVTIPTVDRYILGEG